ncbi:cyclic nucleotide-binding domain-containing protein [Tolypothrix sp. VBCCA 56010]|uniref:cyclic nucleotide-binding domain-containing protein n=1 Tax=Tolypothrix sp. VBCCA 56010 TaxID=3137731 RepID=UPI003D7D123B
MNSVLNNSDLYYRLRNLGMSGGMIHFGSHPDDEDEGLLVYVARKIGGRAVYWSATRGEGGQNRIGSYQREALGIYRTWESDSARAVDGGECLYGPFIDFGYCKNADEPLENWGREQLIKQVVRAIRLVQPQVIVGRWQGIADDFHGHHQAVGLAICEAFAAAGDPNKFPELSQVGLAPWQPQKFYLSTNNTGGDQSVGGAINCFGFYNPDYERDGILRLNTGEYDPIAGTTYQERAWLATNNHRTQGFGLAPNPGDFYYYFILQQSLVAVPARENDLYDGLDPTLTGLVDYPGEGSPFLREKLAAIKALVQDAIAQFNPQNVKLVAESLIAGLKILRETRANLATAKLAPQAEKAIDYSLARKETEFEDVIAQVLGLRLECLSDDAHVIPGQQFRLHSRLWNYREVPIGEVTFKYHLPQGWTQQEIDGEVKSVVGLAFSSHSEVTVAQQATLTTPYWLEQTPERYTYTWPNNEADSRPFALPLISAQCQVNLGETTITLRQGAFLREAFTGGYRELDVKVIPPISVQPVQSRKMLSVQSLAQTFVLTVVVQSQTEHGSIEGTLRTEAPPDWQVEPQRIAIVLDKAKDTKTLQFTVTVPANKPAGDYTIRYVINVGERDYDVALAPVRMGYPGLPGVPNESNCIRETFILSPSSVTVRLLDIKFASGLKYAYVKGAAEEVVEALADYGIAFHLISDEEMGYLDLTQFDAVVVGPNAYLVRDELKKNAERFLKYVEQGGTLIVQYHNYSYEGKGYTPYPIHYNQPHDRVTNEDNPSPEILIPDHYLMNNPNPITTNDFLGWVQDVGMYFFREWDKRYQPIVACHDPGEPPQKGGMLITEYGEGTYLYTGYTFFRQLPAGTPGAFRLIANILSIPASRLQMRAKLLKTFALFSLMSDEELLTVARMISGRYYPTGEYLIRTGDESREMYIVVEGEFEIIEEKAGSEKVIEVAQAGEILGEIGMVGNIKRTLSARAKVDSRVLVIEKQRFRSLIYQYPIIAEHIMQILVSEGNLL